MYATRFSEELRAQRGGFQFLGTQLISYQCGGPQVYTGRDMAASHKHLAISDEEWDSFIAGLHEVCDELGLPQQEVDDVTAVIQSLRADCTHCAADYTQPPPPHKSTSTTASTHPTKKTGGGRRR